MRSPLAYLSLSSHDRQMLDRRLATGMLLGVVAALSGCGSSDAEGEAPSLPELEGEESVDPTTSLGGKADGTGKDWPGNASLPAACNFDLPLQVFFAPDDPTVTLELDLIDRVRAARKNSQDSYTEGANPYRIRYAVYNLTNSVIANRLVQAEAEGIDVQVLIEADQLGNEWVESDDLFARQGLEVVQDYHTLTEETRRTADFIGIKEEGLMHLKTRLFETPEWSALLSGSLNPNGSAAANEETLHLIRDPALIARYAEGYQAVLEGRLHNNVWDDGSALNVLYSPAAKDTLRASTKLLEWLDSEPEQILLMVFSLRDVKSPAYPKSLVTILSEKVAAGIPVYVITDRKQSDGIDLYGNKVASDDWTEDRLRKAGVHVYEALNDAHDLFGGSNAYAAMHHKVAVLGRTNVRVITDASNWTRAALGANPAPESNVETMLFIDSARFDNNHLGYRYLGQWFRVLERYAQQSVERDQEIAYETVVANLLAGSSWPSQSVRFVAEQAYTDYGQEVFATGGLDALGRWGELGPGVQLVTDSASYPTWQSKTPVDLPLGTRFEYKFTARSASGAVKWEGGNNHLGRAAPRVCSTPADGAEVRGRWQ